MQEHIISNGTAPPIGEFVEKVYDDVILQDGVDPFKDTHELFPPVNRHDLSNGRFYTPAEDWWKENYGDRPLPYFPSSTTIENAIGKDYGWDKWLGDSLSYKHAMEYATERADIGTVVHEMIREMILGKEIDRENNWMDVVNGEIVEITDEMMKYLMSFHAFWTDYKMSLSDVLACEVAMINLTSKKSGIEPQSAYDYKYWWCGTADLVTYLTDPKTGKRELWLIDFKTGNPYGLPHELQLISYAILFNSTSPKKIHRIGSLYVKSGWRKKPTYTLKEYRLKPILWRKMIDFWLVWARVNKTDKPKFPMELPQTINLYGDTNAD